MRIVIIDADLLESCQHRLPNLACMKLSNYYKIKGNEVTLALDYGKDQLTSADAVYLSKVFTDTEVPEWVTQLPNIQIGGTGFFFDKAPFLQDEIEHCYPDYELYDPFVMQELRRGIKVPTIRYYFDYSIGFTSRGCFRKCEFCVNKRFDRAFKHSPVQEFLNCDRKMICLLDDNILACPEWRTIFADLKATKKKIQFNQGLDLRLMTDEKAQVISSTPYDGHYKFAFDDINDAELIENKLKIWRRYHKNEIRVYLLCAYKSADVNDIIDVFERLFLLAKYKALPYLMRHENYSKSKWKGMYNAIGSWINQPHIFEKMSFRQMYLKDAERNGGKSSVKRYAEDFEKTYPEVAKKYFDLRYEDIAKTGIFTLTRKLCRIPLLKRIPVIG